ncbi:serine/threonine-protein kinase [Pseudescherichia sp.]|uniref:serine/threonine protein kinase n=1 Tax=Pseudescherichia sp. TaxID=2055881 RepID=UPI0028A28235|nr:serine/threonine-protein kinase [Pseudescherichia sp.]
MLADTLELREFIKIIYPSFDLHSTAKASGQRVVYFGSFHSRLDIEPNNCDSWGEVVLKISEATSRSSISYLQKEIEILKSMDSDCFPKLFFDEVITFDPLTEEPLNPMRIISIEEKIESQTLTDIIRSYNSEDKVVSFLIEMLSALRLLWGHTQALVHRDLKPDNILVRKDGRLVIIDLGILRQEGVKGVTNSFNAIGPCTPCYASPEQAINDKKNISFKTDVFALGIICYEMLSGKNPFLDGDGEQYFDDILERVCEFQPPPLEIYGASTEFSRIVGKMMSKEPFKRYRTVEILLQDLEALV